MKSVGIFAKKNLINMSHPEKQKRARKKLRPIYATDAEWNQIKELAGKDGREASPFVVRTVLGPNPSENG